MNISTEYKSNHNHHYHQPAQRPPRLRRSPQLSLRELRDEVSRMVG